MSANNGKIPRAEALEVLRGVVEQRSFTPETALDDIKFAYNVLQWLMINFTDRKAQSIITSGEPYTTFGLPPAISQSFLTKPISSGEQFDMLARSTLRACPETEIVPARIPILRTLVDDGMNYPQILDYFAQKPADLEGSRMGKCYIIMKYAASIQAGRFHDADWGIRFVVARDSINLLPYGKDGETEPAVNWMHTFRERAHVLAEVATYIGLLTVESEANGIGSLDEENIWELPTILELHGPGGIPFRNVFDGTMDAGVLKALVARGVVSEADLTEE